MGNKKTHAYRVANPELNRAMHGLGSSSATQPHTPRPRKGTRTERERQAIRDQRREAGE
jgi:hypothetical protein